MSEHLPSEHIVADHKTDWKLSKDRINHLQQRSMENLVKLCKQAHFVDVKVRINGEDRWFEVDWIKHLERV